MLFSIRDIRYGIRNFVTTEYVQRSFHEFKWGRDMRQLLAHLLGVSVIVACATDIAQAQMSTGAISGVVADASSGVLPGVIVSVTGARLIGGVQSATTNDAGAFRVDRLPPGSYDVKFEIAGFRTVERREITVNAAFTATLNVRMSLGDLAETITVRGESPTVDTTSTLQQTVISQEILERIPTGRDPWSLSKLIPGVQVAKYDVGGTQSIQQSAMTVHGSTPGDVVYAIDGLNTNWPGGGGGSTSSYYDQGMFEQVNFATSAIPAEQPVGGVFINMVTKQGGNRIQGTFNSFFANGDLQSDNFDDPALQRFGFKSGNPVSKLLDLGASVGGPIVPNRVWWFFSHRQFRLDRVTLGARNPDGSPALDDNLQRTETGKGTWQISASHKFDYLLSLNYNDRNHRRDPPLVLVDDAASTRANALHTTTGPRYTAVIGAKTVFESALMRRSGTGIFGYQPGTLPTDIRIEDPVRNTASVAAPGYQRRPNARTQFNNTLTFALPNRFGSHTMKTGVQFARQSFVTEDRHNGDLDIIFNDGVPNSIRIFNTPTEARSYTNQLGFFVQDDWRLGRVTLNLGGRLDFVDGWNGAVDVPAGRFVGARSFPRTDVLAQRIGVWRAGLVYDVRGDGRTAAKLNYSRYGNQVGIDRVISVNPTVNASGTRSWTDSNGDRIPQDSELGAFSGFTASSARYADSSGPDWPYSDELTAGVEQQIGGDTRLGVMYYRRTNRRQVGTRNVAVPTSAYTAQTIIVPGAPTGPGGSAAFYDLNRAFFGLQSNVLNNDPLLDTDYNGIEITASKRLSSRWQVAGGLTLGRIIGGLNTGDLNDPNNLNNQQGVVGANATYTAKISGSYLMPGDINVSGSLVRAEGFPYQSTFSVTRTQFPVLTRASQRVLLSESGEERYPNVTLLDLRVSRPFAVGAMTIEPLLEVFNVANASTIVTLTSAVGANYLRPTEILGPRLLRIGVRVQFR